jgi:hypothetical protein
VLRNARQLLASAVRAYLSVIKISVLMIKRYSDLIVLTIIWIISIYSIILVFIKSYDIGIQNYIGFGFLILLTALRILQIKKFKTFLAILLLLGTFNAIQYTYSTVTLVFTFSPFGSNFSSLGIQPLSFVLLLFFIIANFSEVLSIINKLLKEENEDPNKHKNQMV